MENNNKSYQKKPTGYELEDLLDREPVVLHNDLILSQVKDRVILITGAAGSIGSELVRQVVQFSPKSIIMLDQAETPLYFLSREMESLQGVTAFHNVLCDITHKKILKEIFKKYRPDIIYHAAAYKHVPLLEENPVQAIFVNVLGTKILADLACKYAADTFVLISTDKAVNPGNVMGASKLIAEKYVQALYNKISKQPQKCTRLITTRFGNVLGSNGSVVPVFEKQIQSGGPITLTHPDMERYFMTIKEACQLVLEAGAMGHGAEIYIFSMGKPLKIADLAHKMVVFAGLVPNKDIEIKLSGLRPGEKLNEELVTNDTKILPTHNASIMIAEEKPMEYVHVLKSIRNMVKQAKAFDINATVSEMKKFIPDFRSINSKYKHFDEY
ncbi:UDP-N-acetylglucosamine 4,6-dehydratase family protein [Flavobacterium rhizosphaerae]|uniref:Polysaccharide biosynthesis protein n=1 Tax=Flavobacterium rhizosphaerae TaxID=3163298 RepID=A0ABW8Z0L6_9FLAO